MSCVSASSKIQTLLLLAKIKLPFVCSFVHLKWADEYKKEIFCDKLFEAKREGGRNVVDGDDDGGSDGGCCVRVKQEQGGGMTSIKEHFT